MSLTRRAARGPRWPRPPAAELMLRSWPGRLAPVLALVFLLAACQTSSGAESADGVRARPFTFPARLDEEPDFGRLELLAGFVLSGSDPRFGGLSGLQVAPDGGRLIALSDLGTLWLAETEHAADGRLVGFAGWQAIEPGTAPGDPPESDAESLAVVGDGLVIAYEGVHRLRRVPLAAPSSPAAALPTPPQLSEPHNVGIEALVGLDRRRVAGDCRGRAHAERRSGRVADRGRSRSPR